MDLHTGGGVRSELHPRIAALARRIQLEFLSRLCFVRLHELSECKGHSGGTRVLNEHASVLHVLVVADFRVSCAPCLTFLCTLFDLGSIQLFGFLGLVQRMNMGNF